MALLAEDLGYSVSKQQRARRDAVVAEAVGGRDDLDRLEALSRSECFAGCPVEPHRDLLRHAAGDIEAFLAQRPAALGGAETHGSAAGFILVGTSAGGTAAAEPNSKPRSAFTGARSSAPTRSANNCANSKSGDRRSSRTLASATSSHPRGGRSRHHRAWNASRRASGSNYDRDGQCPASALGDVVTVFGSTSSSREASTLVRR